MYLFNRSRVARPDTLPSALAWAVDIAGRASSVAGIQVSTWMSMLSQEGGTIVWSAGFDTLPDWEAAFGKLAADADYGAAVAGGGELFTGSVADGLLNVISGMPSEPTDYAYVTAVHATAANGQIGAAMQQGVALAAAATNRREADVRRRLAHYSLAHPRMAELQTTNREQSEAVERISTTVSPVQRNESLLQHNPLGKVPCLVLPDGRSLNRELVAAGYAWWFRRYSTDRGLESLEQAARRARRGLWADENPVPPWDFREAARK